MNNILKSNPSLRGSGGLEPPIYTTVVYVQVQETGF